MGCVKKAGAAPLVAGAKNPSKSADASPLNPGISLMPYMQTIARSMADTGPMGGRYMPHAPPIVGRYGKRPHIDFGRPRLRARVVVPPARLQLVFEVDASPLAKVLRSEPGQAFMKDRDVVQFGLLAPFTRATVAPDVFRHHSHRYHKRAAGRAL